MLAFGVEKEKIKHERRGGKYIKISIKFFSFKKKYNNKQNPIHEYRRVYRIHVWHAYPIHWNKTHGIYYMCHDLEQ